MICLHHGNFVSPKLLYFLGGVREGGGGSLLLLADGMTLPAWLNTTHENAEIINMTTKLIEIRKKELFPNKNKIKVHCTVYL